MPTLVVYPGLAPGLPPIYYLTSPYHLPPLSPNFSPLPLSLSFSPLPSFHLHFSLILSSPLSHWSHSFSPLLRHFSNPLTLFPPSLLSSLLSLLTPLTFNSSLSPLTSHSLFPSFSRVSPLLLLYPISLYSSHTLSYSSIYLLSPLSALLFLLSSFCSPLSALLFLLSSLSALLSLCSPLSLLSSLSALLSHCSLPFLPGNIFSRVRLTNLFRKRHQKVS